LDRADKHELSGQERAALLGRFFTNGARLAAADVAAMMGMRESGAHSLLVRMSRVLPIHQADDGLWESCEHDGPG
jgi:hypothetical protein